MERGVAERIHNIKCSIKLSNVLGQSMYRIPFSKISIPLYEISFHFNVTGKLIPI